MARAVAVLTAAMQAVRKEWLSRASRPAMVVPPGEVTMSFSTAGCSPVDCTMAAAPRDRLGGQFAGLVPGQAILHSPVREGLDEDIDVGGPAPGEAGHGIHEGLFDLQGQADRSEQAAGGFGILRGGGGAACEGCGALPDEGGSVGHGPG